MLSDTPKVNRTLKRLLKISIVLIVFVTALSLVRPKPENMIYGFYAGECIGECGAMYQVSEKAIIKDTTSFWQTYDNFSNFALKHQITSEKKDGRNFNDFKLNIPLIMLLDPRERLGCPDCYDQGGYYLQFTILGLTRRFRIERQQPFYYKNLTKDIEDKLEKARIELQQHGR